MNEILDDGGFSYALSAECDNQEIFSDFIGNHQWDEAQRLFKEMHQGNVFPLPTTLANRINILTLSLHCDVKIPSDYFYLPTKGELIRKLLSFLISEVKGDPNITGDRAIATLELLADGCSDALDEAIRPIARTAVIRMAFDRGFPMEVFRREGRFDEIKRLVVETGFDL